MRPGYVPQPELLAEGITEWCSLFDGWNAERTMQYSEPDFVYPVTAPGHGKTGNNQTFGGTGYLIGPAPNAFDFVGPRPEHIARANLYLTSVAPLTPARIPLAQMTMEEWTSIAVVQFTATNVTRAFAYDPQFPSGVIWFWPPINGNSIELYTWGALAPPAALGTTVAFPPGYQDATVYSLAERLWPLVTHDLAPHKVSHQYLAGKAKHFRARLQAVNANPPRLRNDFQGGRGGPGGSGQSSLTTLLTGVPY